MIPIKDIKLQNIDENQDQLNSISSTVETATKSLHIRGWSDRSFENSNVAKAVKRNTLYDEEESTPPSSTIEEMNGRERLKRHRIEVGGKVRIPDKWGQEELLKDWIDCTAFDASLIHNNLISAREALIEEGRRANSTRLTIENTC